MEDNKKKLSLARFRVRGLFAQFDHTIPTNSLNHVTAITAPNGSGKTVCLRLIEALFKRRWTIFTTTEFKDIVYEFSDGSSIIIKKINDLEGANAALSLFVKQDQNYELNLGHAHSGWWPKVGDIPEDALNQISRRLGFLTRFGQNAWRHDSTGEAFDTQKIIEIYGDRLPVRFSKFTDEPLELKVIIDSIDCHLIETQRLFIFDADERPTYEEKYFRREARSDAALTISFKARRLREIIRKDLAQYATISQSLDRTFPHRFIQNKSQQNLNDIRHSLDALDVLRNDLVGVGLLGREQHQPIDFGSDDIDDADVRVLSVYAEDTKAKLNSLKSLHDKIKLFTEIVNARFRFKSLQIDREEGFRLVSRDRSIPLEKLSSGEQHQLVLFFELLFELSDNALILIDEPELSLHVAWQAKFIEDLLRVINLNEFNVILATHSPILIGKWWDLVVQLGDERDDDYRPDWDEYEDDYGHDNERDYGK